MMQVVVGDQRGILQLISIKKGEPFVDFKVDLKSPVNCVTILVNSNGKSILIFGSYTCAVYCQYLIFIWHTFHANTTSNCNGLFFPEFQNLRRKLL